MKKYVKPQLYYERYELTRQVAASTCAAEMNHWDVGTCQAEWNKDLLSGGVDIFGGLKLFSTEAGCDVASTMFQSSYCYENGATTLGDVAVSVFNS